MPTRLPKALRAIEHATSRHAVLDALQTAVQPDYRVGAIWHSRAPFLEPPAARDFIYHKDVPAEFRKAHRAAVNRHGPSLMAQMAWTDPLPFTFSEAMEAGQPSGQDRWVFDLLNDHGIRDGVYCAHGPWIVVFWANRVLKYNYALSREMRMILNTVASMAVYRLKELMPRNEPPQKTPLSPREIAVLRHLSHGNDAVAIGATLGISPTTVRTFLRRAQQKLEAKSQAHAVAMAVRQRLI